MALLIPLRDHRPRFGCDCYCAPNATLVGDVICGDECSFWFQSVVRGDVNAIRLGDRVNVQDGAVIHCTYQKTQTLIGNNVSIGHRAIVHGCTIHDNVLIGMGAIVMDRAVVESNVVVAAGAVVTEGKLLKSGYIYAGVPARKIKPVPEGMIAGKIERIAKNYVMYSKWYKT